MCHTMELEIESGTKTLLNAHRNQTPQKATTPLPKMPTLLDQALAVVAQRGKARGSLSQGDVAIILNTADLTKTIMLESKTLARQIPAFVSQHHPDVMIASEGDFRSLFVLENTNGRNETPILELKALDTLLVVVDVGVVSENGESAEPTKVKMERVGNGSDAQSERVQQQQQQPNIDWVRAHECFFRMMLNMPSISIKQVRMPTNATTALPLLEGVVVIAERYDCVQAVGSAFKSLSSDWISNRTLYAAAAAQPGRWLAMAVKLESDLVYKEAFVHLAGQHPIFAASVDQVPEDVMASIIVRARELRIKRYEVDQQIVMTTLRVEKQAKGKLTAVSCTVSQHHKPEVYNTVNIWRDWVTEHLSYLVNGSNDSEAIHRSTLCDHPTPTGESQPECLTVAGFYRTLSRGGDAYLPAEQVIQGWNQKEFGCEAGTIRVNLAVLKAEARETVKPVVRSSLQLAEGERDALSYLTCVEVGKVPWASEEEDVDEDIEMEN